MLTVCNLVIVAVMAKRRKDLPKPRLRQVGLCAEDRAHQIEPIVLNVVIVVTEERRKRRHSYSPENRSRGKEASSDRRAPRDSRPQVPAQDPQEMARARGKTNTEPDMLFTRAGAVIALRAL